MHYLSHVGTILGTVLNTGRSWHFALMSENVEAELGKVLPLTVPAMTGDEPWLTELEETFQTVRIRWFWKLFNMNFQHLLVSSLSD